MDNILSYLVLAVLSQHVIATGSEAEGVTKNIVGEDCIITVYYDKSIPSDLSDIITHEKAKCEGKNVNIDINIKNYKTPILSLPADIWNEITTFEMTNGVIQEFPEDLVKAKKLKKVNLSFNKLKSIPNLNIYLNLREVNLSHNEITSEISLKNFKDLTSLDISYNDISKLGSGSETDNHIQLTTINLSHNQIETIPDRFFETCEELTKIDLSHNSIKQALSIVQFQSLSKLKELFLSHNKIQDLGNSLLKFEHLKTLLLDSNCIRSLSSTTFHVMRALKNLDLSSNRLNHIETGTFRHLEKLEKLDLSNNSLTKITKDLLQGNKNLIQFFVSHNQINTIDPESFINNKIREFHFQNNALDGAIDKTIFEGLLISDLDLSNGRIKEIKRECFTVLSKTLIHLNLSNNNIASLSETAFDQLNILKVLDLSNNQLTELPFTANGLVMLEILNVSHNIISDLPELQNLVSLLQLDFSHNHINKIKPEKVSTLTKLKVLKCSNCSLKIANKEILSKLPSLDYLDLSENSLSQFDVDGTNNKIEQLYLNDNKLENINSIKHLANLKVINVARNAIQNIEADTFSPLTEVSRIDLSSNPKLILNNHFENLPNLKYLNLSQIKEVQFENAKNTAVEELDLSSSGIVNLNSVHINNIKNVKDLYLQNNHISILDEDCFKGMNTLTKLDLSHNIVTEIKKDAFQDSKLLEDLNLSQNEISSLSPSAISVLANLKTLNFTKNKITTIKDKSFEHNVKLEKLDLSENGLSFTFQHAFLGLDKLKLLNLEKNNLIDFGPWFLPSKETEAQIILDNNQIKHLRFEEFSYTKVANLSIGGNEILCDEIERAKSEFPNLHLILKEKNSCLIIPEPTPEPPTPKIIVLPTPTSTDEPQTTPVPSKKPTSAKEIQEILSKVTKVEQELLQNNNNLKNLEQELLRNNNDLEAVELSMKPTKTEKFYKGLTCVVAIALAVIAMVLVCKLFIRCRQKCS